MSHRPAPGHPARSGPPCGFTLVELLVVVGIVSVLISVMLPALSRARASASRLQCLSNLRQLQLAQITYAAENRGALVHAGDGTEQGAWMAALQPYVRQPLTRRCPDDRSPHFEQPVPGFSPPRLRTTSYGINNHLSLTHAATGASPPRVISQVRRTSAVVQFTELAETGSYAVADHVHVEQFFVAIAPQLTLARLGQQVPLRRHGGRPGTWTAVVNASFLDGHVESIPVGELYRSPTQNRFDPRVAK